MQFRIIVTLLFHAYWVSFISNPSYRGYNVWSSETGVLRCSCRRTWCLPLLVSEQYWKSKIRENFRLHVAHIVVTINCKWNLLNGWANILRDDILFLHEENFMAIFTTLSVLIWFATGTLGIFATLVYVFTMRVVIYDILSMAITAALSTSILFCNLCYILSWISPRSVVQIAIRMWQTFQHWYTQKKLIHCVAIFTILCGNYYPSHGEFKLICIGKFARRTEFHSTVWEKSPKLSGK